MTELVIDQIATETLLVPIVGTSPLIVHRFSEKAKRQMLEAQQGQKKLKVKRDPQADYEASMYLFDDGRFGFPVIAFKAATIGAARFYGKDVKMTELRQFLFFRGEVGSDNQQLADIDGKPQMREDVVRIGMGTTDLRYRAEFWPWSTTLNVTYVTSALQRSSVLSLIDAGGLGVGVGEWRAEKKGDFGSYQVDLSRTVEVVE